MDKAYCYDMPIGRVLITEDEKGITGLCLLKQGIASSDELLNLNCEFYETVLIRETSLQLSQYLEGKRKTFDLPLNPKGTLFQQKVWAALREIPYGETRSYKQIACAVGNEKACRAVGMANHNNPVLCIIPCHRVIGANGSLVGFGAGLDLKEQLLGMEKRINNNT